MAWYETLLKYVPEVKGPEHKKKLDFKVKLKWTAVIITLFFVMRAVPLYGLGINALEQFRQFATILAVDFGSLVSLGIGPIVTASIVLQLLNGSGVLKFDTHTPAGRKKFQGVQKLTTYFFVIFESLVFVLTGALAADPALAGTVAHTYFTALLIIQLIVGGILIVLMDEVTTKWGLGSGVSLFIVAGVSEQVLVRLFSWIRPAAGAEFSVGAVPQIFQALAANNPITAWLAVAAIAATVVVFCLAVYGQAMKVEIPLSFGRVRGQGIRWPLNFIYTSVIPVILIAALLANISLGATLLSGRMGWDPNTILAWVSPAPLVPIIIQNQSFLIGSLPYLQTLVYTLVLIAGATLFSWFWVQTAGMDAHSQAKQIMSSGLQVPGFRKDIRVLEHLLARYIGPLTIMGGILIGILAASADILGALTEGTSLLLAVMIIYKLYEDIARQHMMDMNPMMRKFMGGN